MVLETALCVCVHFLSDQGWQYLSQTTGFILNQHLAPFLSFGEIRYSKHISLSLTNSVTRHNTVMPTYLLHSTKE